MALRAAPQTEVEIHEFCKPSLSCKSKTDEVPLRNVCLCVMCVQSADILLAAPAAHVTKWVGIKYKHNLGHPNINIWPHCCQLQQETSDLFSYFFGIGIHTEDQ